jgi:pyruvate/oxaloacetate carboxyltransferase
MRAWRLFRARRHRAAAKKQIDELHMALHDRASLGVQNADLWSAIMRGVDALALSRWLAADELTAADVRPARQTVQIILRDLTDLIGLLSELEWPGEQPAPSESSPPSST